MLNIRLLRGLSLESSSGELFMIRRFESQAVRMERRERTSVIRAMEHYDDFYSSVYGKKWPSFRLALLSEAKYMAIPNTFTGNVLDIGTSLETLGAFDVKGLWTQGRELLQANMKIKPKEMEEVGEFREAEEENRLEEMDKTLVSYAQTKVAEELDVLYQNAPERKLPVRATEGVFDDRRVLKDIREASQEYVTPTKLKGMEEFQLESEYFMTYGQGEEEMESGWQSEIYRFTNLNNCTKIEFPSFIRPYTFEAGNASSFPASGKNPHSGLRNYLCVNGASLAPIVALDLKLDMNVLDLCAGPGTKTLMMLMTMCPALLTCNDLESSRLSRIRKILTEFLGGSKPGHVRYTKFSGAKYPVIPEYHRVLVDVPCTSDRISLTVQENNFFKPARTKERLGIVELQKQILLSAFKCLIPIPGSACVYSTCTLSPIENDGVVGAALKKNDVKHLAVDLIGLWKSLAPFQAARLFYLTRTKFGVLIEPNVISNFGPMYISRIVVQGPPN